MHEMDQDDASLALSFVPKEVRGLVYDGREPFERF